MRLGLCPRLTPYQWAISVLVRVLIAMLRPVWVTRGGMRTVQHSAAQHSSLDWLSESESDGGEFFWQQAIFVCACLCLLLLILVACGFF